MVSKDGELGSSSSSTASTHSSIVQTFHSYAVLQK